ncbi:hypothetical protein SUGI_0717860 [Cryptomeria japonica]|nr:hypothetical protein SUGI_0717860 [Cryptomeria japonica]
MIPKICSTDGEICALAVIAPAGKICRKGITSFAKPISAKDGHRAGRRTVYDLAKADTGSGNENAKRYFKLTQRNCDDIGISLAMPRKWKGKKCG